MKRSPEAQRAWSFELDAGAPLHQQIYERIREAISERRLSPGERLPSTRSLAAQLNIARGTVDAAFGRLAGEGLIQGRGAAGTVVASDSVWPRAKRGMPAAITPGYSPPDDFLWPLRGGMPALDLFPRALWSSLATRSARRWDPQKLCYPDPRGLPELRAAIAAHLLVSRGIACDPSQVFVTSGYQAAQQVVTSLVMRDGDEVWLEDPGYRFARRALEQARLRLSLTPVDDHGLDVEYARRRHPSARLAIVTPGHHSPLGVALSSQRRQSLLEWAQAENAWILEDDYDSEFHYRGRKPASLKSMDRRDRVFHAGSFSKTLFPGLRLGYLVAPVRWVADVAGACELSHRGLSVQDQGTLAAFMQLGHYARHLRRMRLRYAERSKALASALNRRFRKNIRLLAPDGGLTLLARFAGSIPDVELVSRARAKRLAPSALSAHSIRHHHEDGLLMGFTNVAVENAEEVAHWLEKALKVTIR